MLTPIAVLVVVVVLLVALYLIVCRLERDVPADSEYEIEARAWGVKIYRRVSPSPRAKADDPATDRR